MRARTIFTWASVISGLARAEQSTLSPHGPAARGLSTLTIAVLVTFSVVAVVMFALIIAGALRKKGDLSSHEAPETAGGHAWIFVGGGVSAAILAVLFVLGLKATDDFPLHDEDHQGYDIRITGHQWWWEVEYVGEDPHQRVVTANEIHVPVGAPVDFELVSADVIHSFWVPQLHGKVDLIPGRENHLRLQADEAGIFEGQCSEFCGAEHAQMRLLLIAEPPEAFARWLEGQRRDAVAPEGQVAQTGQTLFEDKACGLCHTIRGTQALGTVGPDLTHLASRRGLAADSIPNSHAYLAAWIVRAQTLKPEAQMPNLGDLSGAELRELTAYLRELE